MTLIRVPVFYINTEFGFGDASHTVSLLTNSTVTYDIVRDYGTLQKQISGTNYFLSFNIENLQSIIEEIYRRLS